jgi:hypothetical protein
LTWPPPANAHDHTQSHLVIGGHRSRRYATSVSFTSRETRAGASAAPRPENERSRVSSLARTSSAAAWSSWLRMVTAWLQASHAASTFPAPRAPGGWHRSAALRAHSAAASARRARTTSSRTRSCDRSVRRVLGPVRDRPEARHGMAP